MLSITIDRFTEFCRQYFYRIKQIFSLRKMYQILPPGLRQSLQNGETRWMIGLIVLGCLLRLVWAEDMVWKGDEIWMYQTARAVVDGQIPYPALGMYTSMGFLNPGLGVWCFIALAWVSKDPIAMVYWVMGSNIVAIGLFAAFVRRYIPQSERSIWFWGLTMLSVNPLAIHFSRTLWTNDILPFVGFFVFVGHWFRQTRSGAFTWGLIGTLIGQIHMSGFFWQGALVLVSLWKEKPWKGSFWKHQSKNSRQTRWGFWLLGTGIGIPSLVPWIAQMGGTAATVERPSWAEILTPNFPLHWLLSGWGLNLEYNLGEEFWRSFIQEPRILGIPSFGSAIALLLLAVSAIAALVRWWRDRDQVKPQFVITDYFWAGGVVMPLLLLLARVRVPAQYLIVLYPFIQIWAAWLERGRMRSLILICAAQLFLSICFLTFIHIHGGNSNWPYGLVYHLHPLQNP